MNKLPHCVLEEIYKLKHQLEYKDVLKELLNTTTTKHFNDIKSLIKYIKTARRDIKFIIIENEYISPSDFLLQYDNI
jgi:hypothetical protein